MIRRTAALAISLGVLGFACQLVAGIDRVDKSTAVADVQAQDAPSAAPNADPCVHSGLPGPPAVDDDPSRELPPIVLALSRFSLKNDGDAVPGIDLDGVCTCDERVGTAHDGGESCVRKGKIACDSEGGVDNAFATVAEEFAIAIDVDQLAGVNDSIALGKLGALLFIRKYNGLANDREVELGIAASQGLFATTCPNAVPDDGGRGTFSPGWCGDDAWSYAPGSMAGGFPVAWASGHVTDYQVVVALDRAATLPFGGVGLAMGAPLFFGKLVPLGDDFEPRDPSLPPTPSQERLYRLEQGLIVGRAPVSDLLAAAGAAVAPGGGAGNARYMCQNEATYLVVQNRLCAATDIARSPKLDFVSGYPCDAISMTVHVTALPARVAEEYAPPPSNNPCVAVDGGPSDSGTSVKTYSCNE